MRLLLGSLLPIFFCALASSAAAITIDLFDGSQAVQANPGNQLASVVADSGVLGGVRSLDVTSTTGLGGLFIRATVVSGVLTHSQDATVTGLSRVVWDGDLNPGVTFAGLGGIDLTEDGSDAFVLDVVSFDFAGSKPLKLNIIIYDASDPAGHRSSSTVFEIRQAIFAPQSITIPYAALNIPGSQGPANLTNVGAMVFEIDGLDAPDRDFTLAAVRTNGSCSLAPGVAGGVVDECGVCGGDNSTCLDCLGVVNGPNREDRCGVCAGNGRSCLNCVEQDLTPLLATLDGGAKEQENLIRLLLRQLERRVPGKQTKLFVKQTRGTARTLQLRNWTLAWIVPSRSLQCENKLFCSASSNVSTMDEYRLHNEELRQLALTVVAGITAATGLETRRATKLLAHNEELFTTNLQNSYRVPLTQDNCS